MATIGRRKSAAPAKNPPPDEPYVGLDPDTGRPYRTGMPHVLITGITSASMASWKQIGRAHV